MTSGDQVSLTLFGAITATVLAIVAAIASFIVVPTPLARSAEMPAGNTGAPAAGVPAAGAPAAGAPAAGAPAEKSASKLSDLQIVDSRGNPVAGAMVTSTSSRGIETTRFTGADGRVDLRFPKDPIRVHARGFRSAKATAGATIALKRDPAFLEQLPSSQWLSLLPEGDRKQEFILNCGTCHELTHARVFYDGKPRGATEWRAAIAMMRAMDAFEVIPPDFDDETYADWLATHLTAESIDRLTPTPADAGDTLSGITITEYPLPIGDALPHDLVLGPDDRIWVTAFLYDEIWAVEPATGAVQRYPVDDDPDRNAQPRALKFDRQGYLWIVNGGAYSVLRLDPADGSYRSFDVGMYPHSLDIDSDGTVWVNDYFATSERIARVSNPDGEVRTIEVPPANRPASEGLPLPYGLQLDARGRLYSTQLAANTLVVYDTRSGKAGKHEMPFPNSGPRRPGLGPDQSLWIPEFNTGYITRFDPETAEFERFALGDSAMGAYDVEVDPSSGMVWVTGSLDSSLLRFDPSTADVLRIPLPTEPAYMRHLAVDPASGDVWTAYSSLPAAKPKLVRVTLDRKPASGASISAIQQ